MARLAELQLHEAVGELAFMDGEYTEMPKRSHRALAIFAVSQMADANGRHGEEISGALLPSPQRSRDGGGSRSRGIEFDHSRNQSPPVHAGGFFLLDWSTRNSAVT
jgi:hypothetical protein